jgi:ATP-dependent Zn protease
LHWSQGFAGADLANVVNEAALLAARRGKGAFCFAALRREREREGGGW